MAQDHEIRRKITIDKLKVLEQEALTIQSKIDTFERSTKGIKVIDNGLTLKQLVNDAQQEFLSYWESRKVALTNQAKMCIKFRDLEKLQSEVDQYNRKFDSLSSNVSSPTSVSSLSVYVQDLESSIVPELWKKFQACCRESMPVQETTTQSEQKLKENLKNLQFKIEKGKQIITSAQEYFSTVRALEKLLGETNQEINEKLDKVINKDGVQDADLVQIRSIYEAFQNRFRDLESRLGSHGFNMPDSINSEAIRLIRHDYERTTKSVTQIITKLQEHPPPRPPPPAPITPYFEIELKDTSLMEGDQCLMTAKVGGDPLPRLTWFKDGVSVEQNPDYQTRIDDTTGWASLRIAETLVADSANWSVRASNPGGYAVSCAKLTVKESRPLATPPSVIVPLQQTSTKEGETLILTCHMDGLPIPELAWFKDDHEISNHSKYRIKNRNGIGELTLPKVESVASGLYTCKGINEAGTAVSSAGVTITPKVPFRPPAFIEPLSNSDVKIGNPLVLKAILYPGYPIPDVKWKHNGRSLDKHCHWDPSKNLITLFIEEATEQWEGQFTCFVKNESGEATSTANVSIHVPKPIIKATPPTFYVPLKDQVKSVYCSIFGGQTQFTFSFGKFIFLIKVDFQSIKKRKERALTHKTFRQLSHSLYITNFRPMQFYT